jgi:hypothetical protein
MSWVMPKRVIDCLLVSGSLEGQRVLRREKMAPIYLFWCLWREMKNKSFEDLERTLKEISSSFYHTVYLWTTAYVHPLSFSFDNFLARFFHSN